MRRTNLLLAALLIAPALTWAAPPSAVVSRQELLREMREETAMPSALGKAAGNVGDPDSFGRGVKWLGVMGTGMVSFAADCTGMISAPEDRCVTLKAAPGATTFKEGDIARIDLPANSSNSLLCQWVTPTLYYNFSNPTNARATAQLRLVPSLTVDNPVLKDPSLIDPNTGLPFGGAYTETLPATVIDQHTIDPGQRQTQRTSFSRLCIGGVINKQNLMLGWGFTQAQADAFFNSPMTLHLNLTGTAALVDFATVMYGVRFVGD